MKLNYFHFAIGLTFLLAIANVMSYINLAWWIVLLPILLPFYIAMAIVAAIFSAATVIIFLYMVVVLLVVVYGIALQISKSLSIKRNINE